MDKNVKELTINKTGIKSFLDLISLSGEHQNKEALLTINKNGISTSIKSPANSIALKATLKGEYTDLGEIGIDDIALLKSALNIQDKEEITLKIRDNKLNIASVKTKASLLIRDSEFIKNKPKDEEFNKYIDSVKGNEFSLDSEVTERLIKTYNLIKSENVVISSEGNKTIKFIFNKLDNIIESEVDIDNKIEPFKVIVNSYLFNILNFIKEASISIKKESAVIMVTFSKDNLEINYIIATLGK